MANSHGQFVWYDVMTTDTKAAAAFYTSIFGWTAQDTGMADRSYTVFSSGQTMVAGLMPIPEDARAAGVQPSWMGYIGVENVDQYAHKLVAAGGKIHRGPEDIPDIGRFAVASDPHGAGFLIFTGMSEQQPIAAAPGTPGHVGWRELHAGDPENALAFYSGLFGWKTAQSFDMGALGAYQIFAIDGTQSGGIMRKAPEAPYPFWLYYFNVPALDSAMDHIKRLGGTICHEPLEVPGGSWIAQCLDPHGASFAILSAKR